MRRAIVLAAVLCVASCAARAPSPPEPQEPSTPFSGTWREIRNQNKPVKGGRWTFKGDSITIEDPESTYSGTFTYDEEADPCEMDIHFDGYPVNEAIYRLSGNTLMIKLLDTATRRSDRLRPERGYIFITCYKEKPEEKTDDR